MANKRNIPVFRRPSSLSGNARKVWDRVVATHDHLGAADALLLAQYCELHAQLDAAIELGKESGPLAISEKGVSYMAPAWQVVCALQPRVWRMARDLRIITSDRASQPRTSDTKPRILKLEKEA